MDFERKFKPVGIRGHVIRIKIPKKKKKRKKDEKEIIRERKRKKNLDVSSVLNSFTYFLQFSTQHEASRDIIF